MDTNCRFFFVTVFVSRKDAVPCKFSSESHHAVKKTNFSKVAEKWTKKFSAPKLTKAQMKMCLKCERLTKESVKTIGSIWDSCYLWPSQPPNAVFSTFKPGKKNPSVYMGVCDFETGQMERGQRTTFVSRTINELIITWSDTMCRNISSSDLDVSVSGMDSYSLRTFQTWWFIILLIKGNRGEYEYCRAPVW